MSKLTRRKMLVLGGSMVTAGFFANTGKAPLSTNEDYLFDKAHISWSRAMTITPEHYITQTNFLHLKKYQQMEYIKADFKEDRMIMVDGMVISYIETALLASLSKFATG